MGRPKRRTRTRRVSAMEYVRRLVFDYRQADIALILDVSQRTVSNYERPRNALADMLPLHHLKLLRDHARDKGIEWSPHLTLSLIDGGLTLTEVIDPEHPEAKPARPWPIVRR